MENLLAGLYVVFAVVIAWALVEAVQARSLRWTLTILMLPVVGAMAWFVTGRALTRTIVRRHSSEDQPHG